MTGLLGRLRRSRRGAAAIEFALTAPVFFALIIGTAQIGLVFRANAGMKHALGEAARYATLFPTPTDDQIKDKLRARQFGLDPAKITALTTTRGTDSGTGYIDIAMSYKPDLNFGFITAPGFTMTETRRAFLP